MLCTVFAISPDKAGRRTFHFRQPRVGGAILQDWLGLEKESHRRHLGSIS